MAGDRDAEGTSYILEPGKGELLQELRVTVKAGTEHTEGAISVVEVDNPGFGGPPLHVHHEHDELLYVLEGEYLFQIEDTVSVATAGTFGFFPRGVPHTFAGSGRMQSRLLNMGLPAGLERYVRELERRVAAGAGEDEIQRLSNEWDTYLVGPPIAASSQEWSAPNR